MSDELVNALVEFTSARQVARANRAAFKKSPASKFVKSMQAAMREYERMLSEGVSSDDAERGIEAVLHDTWPHTPRRSDTCGTCDGTGWRERLCQHAVRCNRKKCGLSEPQWEHAYVVPCDCVDGDRHRAKIPTGEDSLVSVGRSKRPSKMKARWKSLSQP